jgi:Spy/CpxP family protein refolding chaperone
LRGVINPKLIKKFNLPPHKQTKLKALNEYIKTKREAIKNDASLSDDQKKDAFRALMKENMKDRDAIYTPEQKALIEKSRKDRMAQWKAKKASDSNQ